MKLHAVPSGKNDYILYYAKSIRVGSKTTTKNVERIGKLSELKTDTCPDPIAYYKALAKQRTEEGRVPSCFTVDETKKIDTKKKKKVRLGYIVPQQTYYALGLDDCMRRISHVSKMKFDFCRIVRDLVCGRLIDPLSKMATYRLASSFPEPPDYQLEDVYRALKKINSKFDYIQKQAYAGSKEYAEVNTDVVYYDCTNFYFEIEEQDGFRNYGHSKENRPNPIVQMGLFLDRNGIPISMCITKGSESEQKTMIPLEKKMTQDFGIRKFIVCADCGLSGSKNLKFNSNESRGFVVTKSLKKVTKEMRDHLMGETGWKRLGDSSGRTYSLSEFRGKDEYLDAYFYHDEKFVGKDGFEERIVTTYNERMRRYQGSIRDGQVQRAFKLIKEGKIKLRKKNQNDPRRFVKAEHATKDGEAAEEVVVTIDNELIEKERAYDGFYAVTTDLDDDVGTVIRVNKGRWEIEESFRILKSELGARPAFVSLEECIRAHFLCCYLSLLVFRVLEQRMAGTGESYTAFQIIDSIKGYDAIDMGNFYIGAMEGDACSALEKATGLSGSTEALSKARFRALVKRSKEKPKV